MADLKASDETAASTVSDTHGWAIEAAGVDKWLTFLVAASYFQAKLRDTDVTLAANSDALFASQKAVKAYVDALGSSTATAIAAAIAGLSWKAPVRLATAAALPACTYANGSSGVGATLTGNSNGALASQDGVTPALNDRIAVKNQAAGLQNGLYKLTQLGDGSTPFILTRTTDADTSAELRQASLYVEEGTANGDKQFVLTTNAPLTIGTTALTLTVFSSGSTVDDTTISTTDNTTNNASTSKHGWLMKLSGVATEYLDGTGTFSTPAGGGGGGATQTYTAHNGANYTFVLADANNIHGHQASDTTARTWTVPANSAVAFAEGTILNVDVEYNAGPLTIQITTDTLELVGGAGATGSRTIASGGQATLTKIASTKWRISGIGVT